MVRATIIPRVAEYMYAWIQCCYAAGDPVAQVLAYVQARQRVDMLVETAGLFWIAAELAILFLVLAGCRHLETTPLAPQFNLTSRERYRLAVGAAAFVLLSAGVMARYAFPAPIAPEDAAAVLSNRVHVHIAIWAAFVTTWVLLEILIVFHGWRGYRRLRRLFFPAKTARPVPAAVCALMGGAWLLASWHANALDTGALNQAIRDANKASQVYWNALYLYLRLAGAVWIAVEWWAAVLLVRGYRMLARVAATRKTMP